jgi:hypothetical protein
MLISLIKKINNFEIKLIQINLYQNLKQKIYFHLKLINFFFPKIQYFLWNF